MLTVRTRRRLRNVITCYSLIPSSSLDSTWIWILPGQVNKDLVLSFLQVISRFDYFLFTAILLLPSFSDFRISCLRQVALAASTFRSEPIIATRWLSPASIFILKAINLDSKSWYEKKHSLGGDCQSHVERGEPRWWSKAECNRLGISFLAVRLLVIWGGDPDARVESRWPEFFGVTRSQSWDEEWWRIC